MNVLLPTFHVYLFRIFIGCRINIVSQGTKPNLELHRNFFKISLTGAGIMLTWFLDKITRLPANVKFKTN